MRRLAIPILIAFALWHCADKRPPPSAAAARAQPSELETWHGHVEHADFDDEQGRLSVELLRVDGALTGKVKFGEGPQEPPEPADTPTAGDVRLRRRADGEFVLGHSRRELEALKLGFEYAIYKVRQDGARLRFHIELGDADQAWCSSQRARPRLEGTDAWGCPAHSTSRSGDRCEIVVSDSSLPDAGLKRAGRVHARVPVDCELFDWCSSLQRRCHCGPKDCVARPGVRIAFDLTRQSDDGYQGSIAFGSAVLNVRLRRK